MPLGKYEEGRTSKKQFGKKGGEGGAVKGVCRLETTHTSGKYAFLTYSKSEGGV